MPSAQGALTEQDLEEAGRKLVRSLQNGQPGFDPQKARKANGLPFPEDVKLKDIPPLTRECVALHLNGFANAEIGYILGVTPQSVGSRLRAPNAKKIIAHVLESAQEELSTLMLTGISQHRRFLGSSDPDVALRALDMLYKTQGTYKREEGKSNGAEEVLSRVVEMFAERSGELKEGERIGVRVLERRNIVPGLQDDLDESEED